MKKNERTWPTYEEAKWLLRSRNIETRKKYFEWHKENRVAFVPYAPHRVYELRGEWIGWNDYLGNNNAFKSWDKKEYYSFYEAARWVHSLRLDSVQSWKTYVRENELPEGIPKNPEYAYRDVWNKSVAYTEWLGLNLHAKVDVASEVSRSWALVHIADMPPNVFTLIKDVETTIRSEHTVRYQVLAMYEYESDLEDQLWNVLNSMTTVYGDDVHRMCSNYYQVQSQLDRFLLKQSV
jgi:hypothetical protein